MEERDDLIARLENAFPPRLVPLEGVTSWEKIPGGEDEEITNKVKGRDWRSISDEEYNELPACFLTNEALAVLLPGLLIAHLRLMPTYTRIKEFQLIPYSKSDKTPTHLRAMLSEDQRSAVVAYLEFWERAGDSEASEALQGWRQSHDDSAT